MYVLKRNGTSQNLDVSKLRKVVNTACKDFENCNPLELEMDAQITFKDGMTTKEIQQILIQTAVEKTSIEAPEWQFVASRLKLRDLYKDASLNRKNGGEGYGNFYNLILDLTNKGIYGEYILLKYNDREIKELENYIKPERDFLFNYIGLKHMVDRYMACGFNKEIYELPQERFMIIAMHLAIQEQDYMYWTKQFYDIISKHESTVATPTLSNAGKPFPQLSSCFIDTVADDLISIYDADKAFARVSKFGGGMGLYVGKVRAKNSEIRGFKNASSGVIPWIKNYNNTAIAVNQLGLRAGSVSIYLDVWHKDILDFLNLKTNNGDDRLKAHDIFPAVSIPDIFMKAVEEKGNWYLFCPHEVKKVMGFSLEDCYDDDDQKEFTKRYNECVNTPTLSRDAIPAIEIMKRIMKSTFETGTPFLFFRDTVNKLNPNKHCGMVYSSNLCTEIIQNMSPQQLISEEVIDENGDKIIVQKYKAGDFVVCNLATLNLGKVKSDEDIARIVPIQIRLLDNVIDNNMYPLKNAEITNQNYRSIGLGCMGLAQYLAERQIAWESEKHLSVVDHVFELINYHAIKASMSIAREKGTYKKFKGSEWETGKYFERRNYDSEKWLELKEKVKNHGLRNAYLLAVAPNGSTSIIFATSSTCDPIFRKFFVEEKKGTVIPQTAPNLNPTNFWYYKEAHTIDQIWSIRSTGVRQRHVDQSQSFNMYITPNIPAKELLNLYIQAWKNGLKTTYYLRNQSVEVDDCVSCSA